MKAHTRRLEKAIGAAAAAFAVSLSACAEMQRMDGSHSDGSTSATGGREMDQVARSTLREKALQLLSEGAVSELPMIRANSIEGLQPAPSRAEPAARAGLRDENAGVRFAAAMTVGMLQLQESGPFLEPLLSDADPRVRAAAMYAFVRLGRPVDLTPLAQMLEDADPRFRSEAARVLGELGNPSAIPMLRTAAAQSTRSGSASGGQGRYQSERLFQLQVAEALAKLGEPAASDSVRAALYPAAREGFESSALAAQILGNIRDSKAVGQLVDLIEQTTPGVPLHEDPRKNSFVQPPEVRLAAARSLALMGYGGGMYVAEMYASNPNPAIRAQSAFVFGAGRRPADLTRLATMMGDSDPMVRTSAAAAALTLLDRLK